MIALPPPEPLRRQFAAQFDIAENHPDYKQVHADIAHRFYGLSRRVGPGVVKALHLRDAIQHYGLAGDANKVADLTTELQNMEGYAQVLEQSQGGWGLPPL